MKLTLALLAFAPVTLGRYKSQPFCFFTQLLNSQLSICPKLPTEFMTLNASRLSESASHLAPAASSTNFDLLRAPPLRRWRCHSRRTTAGRILLCRRSHLLLQKRRKTLRTAASEGGAGGSVHMQEAAVVSSCVPCVCHDSSVCCGLWEQQRRGGQEEQNTIGTGRRFCMSVDSYGEPLSWYAHNDEQFVFGRPGGLLNA